MAFVFAVTLGVAVQIMAAAVWLQEWLQEWVRGEGYASSWFPITAR